VLAAGFKPVGETAQGLLVGSIPTPVSALFGPAIIEICGVRHDNLDNFSSTARREKTPGTFFSPEIFIRPPEKLEK